MSEVKLLFANRRKFNSLEDVFDSEPIFSVIDADIYDELVKYPWYLNNYGYFVCSYCYLSQGKTVSKTVLLHQFIYFLKTGYPSNLDSISIDHINRIKIDNRIDNLRLASHSQQRVNRGVSSNNTSGFKGVCWNKKGQKWRSLIDVNGTRTHLGYFDSKEEAFQVYSQKHTEIHGFPPIV